MQKKRMAGVLMPLFSLRRENDHGIGDLCALREWVDWAADHGVSFLQLLPVNALGSEPSPSPYSAISSVALEPLYLSLEPWALPGMSERIIFPPEDLPPLMFPAGPDLVDYSRVRLWKKSVLHQAWRAFSSEEEYRMLRPHFRQWALEQGDWLNDFACFSVASHLFGTSDWWKWPEQDPNRVRLIAGEYRDRLDYEKWLQWLCYYQWKLLRAYAELRGVALMGDMPIGVSMASSDVFFERRNFDMEWSGGAPAEGDFADDPFTGKWGQNWGVPLYRWDEMEKDGFRWWKRRVRRMAEIFSICRIDHILGFYRIYAFPWKPEDNPVYLHLTPDEAAARCGGRRPGFKPCPDDAPQNRRSNLTHGDRLLRVLLEAVPGMRMVGEDLGCVPDYVRPDMSMLRIAGFKIPHWEIEEGRIIPGSRYNPCSFAVYTTHDFAPFMESWNEWWQGVRAWLDVRERAEELEERKRNELKNKYEDCRRVLLWFADYCGMQQEKVMSPWTDGVKDKLYRALFSSRSNYTSLMWTELFDEARRLNIPGTVGGCNWRPRMPFTAREAGKLHQSAWLRELIETSGRAPMPSLSREEALGQIKIPDALRIGRRFFSSPAEYARELGKTKYELLKQP
ncbi:MAG: 4-alpha-glucanotransferase [Akkermansia sp.]|nr:4-alpha-glucanotransferase [Akkermansia sp.]